MSPLAVHLALTLAFIESLGLAVLLWRVKGVPGLRLLVAFLCGVAVWVLSCELTTWFGPKAAPFAASLVGLSAVTSAVFLHFVLVLCKVPNTTRLLRVLYALTGSLAALAVFIPAGRYEPWLGFESFFMPNAMGWVIGLLWAGLAAAGHAVMAWHWWHRRGAPRGQLVAMCLASGWGAACMSGYAFPHWGLQVYPYPLLLLPLYPLILVYGILRYQLMIVNAWARRGLAWALVVGLGSAAVIGLAALPLPFGEPLAGWRLWAAAVSTLLVCGLLLDPFRRLATRLVYPGSHLDEHTAEGWRSALGAAESFSDLARVGAAAISKQLRVEILVWVDGAGASPPQTPALHCQAIQGHWRTDLIGWDAAPPGPRYVAQLFGAALADAAQRLEQALSLALREREHQQQARLAELGALAATVAHDIRNPLNIIAMAAATAPAEMRREIATQTARISQLASDLLDYAKSWQIDAQPFDLTDFLRATAARYPEFELGEGLSTPLPVRADARRLRQALLNLFDNARAAVASNSGAVQLDAARLADGRTELTLSDQGSGVPMEIRDTLFQPFISRRPDGTGLGLAIVAKIIEAHGGTVRLDARAGWVTTFAITLPAP